MSFEDFWLCYPKKVAKQDALKAWGKLTLFDHAQIDCVLEVHCKLWRKMQMDFIPHAATWLRGRRWEDEAVTVQEPQEVGAWIDECKELHQGRCGNAFFHAAKREQES